MSRRPKDLTPEQLRFVPQKPVRWLSPRTLIDTSMRFGLARVFGGYVDKREIIGNRPQPVYDHSGAEELWIDYVADIGDGFNATYSIAYLMAQDELDVGGERLPRGSVLVMGGDEVYPAGDWVEYEQRMKGPYEAANPGCPVALYAIPGNHDWFDGLTAFARQFTEGRTIGGYRTFQKRSYYALNLPHRWWLFALDAQFDTHLDQNQIEYFRRAAEQMQPGDQVILCVAQPSWLWTAEDPRSFDRIDHFIRDVIAARGGRVPLILTGDRHHYAHYSEVDGVRHLVGAGGGGAYLSPTHTLPEELTAPRKSVPEPDAPEREYRLTQTYPSKAKSMGYAFGIFARLPWLNKGFVALMAVVSLIATVSILEGTGTTVAVAAVLLGAGVGFAHPGQGRRTSRHYILGGLHGLAQVALSWTGAQIIKQFDDVSLWTYLVYLPLAGLAGTWLVGLYLVVANRLGVNANELFAGMSVIDQKCFLRIRVDANGATVYPIGLDRVGRQWAADPEGGETDSWIKPVTPLKPRLIEPGFAASHPGPSAASLPRQNPVRRFMAQAGEWFSSR
ncbi:MAG: metallophosphoesterase [Glycomyces artemisiae]|uniref:Calcineurin-like phosphoesterase family protein n=1 Tax=Glycomyces artemisiae TaxID=1076443 RepID=A0A2T0USU7_9ACTN|nr:metallophosphoesterase [Glycomyces artemisiae]NUQ90425.1 metallophosphoesterase [Glycomyces artemisiae]PRY60986.1 calcineurin-like phosphoesterase family protein [Glycomyces artemisiae]